MSLPFGVLTLALGFSVSGAVASGYEALTGLTASFRLLRAKDVSAVVAVPVVTLGAAYILVRNMLYGGKRPVAAVFVSTVASGLWSLVIGGAMLSAFA